MRGSIGLSYRGVPDAVYVHPHPEELPVVRYFPEPKGIDPFVHVRIDGVHLYLTPGQASALLDGLLRALGGSPSPAGSVQQPAEVGAA